jgi:hypothetical protein
MPETASNNSCDDIINALSNLFKLIKSLGPGESANVLQLRKELFKATFSQNSFSLNQKADAVEALYYLLNVLHQKLGIK